MRIGINLLYLFPRAVGGTETYARGLIEGLKKIDRKNQYFLFCNEECAPTFSESSNFKVVKLPVRAANRVKRSLFELFWFPYYLRKYKIDVVHSLGYSSPIFSPCPTVVNIYDLNWYYHPEDFSLFRRIGWRLFVASSARFCNKIITSSQSSKNHISKVLGVPENKIEVIYGGAPSMQKPYLKKTLVKLGIEDKYIFTLTADIPHKNIIGLLEAYKILLESGKKYTLVIGGSRGRMDRIMRSFIVENKLGKRIIILGWLTERELSTLYKYASVFVIPSLHEGFGFPVLEAFTFGTPLVSSNAFSLKEVVGKAGLLVDPRKPREIAASITKAMEDTHLRRSLSILGKNRAANFRWVQSAKKALKVYHRMINN